MKLIGTGYEALAEAIILQAADDLKNADDPSKHIDKKEAEDFFTSEWYEFLTTINGKFILDKAGK